MAEVRKWRIIVAKDEVSAGEIAGDQIMSIRGGANVVSALDDMASARQHQEDDILVNEDLGLVFTNLTDKEAAKVSGTTGVSAVEDDEEVFAVTDEPASPFTSELDGESESLDDHVLADEEAEREIDYAQEFLENAEEPSAEEMGAAVDFASQSGSDFGDEIDFDEDAGVVALNAMNDPGVAAAADAMAIPRDKIAKLIKCILKCAISEFAGASEINEEAVSALLERHGISGDQSGVQAIRDYITCGLRLIYAPHAWRYSTGRGVRVAVVDTGITPRHRDLRVYGGVNLVRGATSWGDDNGHGTHVAGTIAAVHNNAGVIGVAPHARLYAVKVLDRNGRGRTSAVINGLDWCHRARMHIVNLSLGSLATTHNPRIFSAAYEQVGKRLRSRGILAVAAAGNSGSTSRPYVGNPARCPSFMAVSAVDCNRRRARFSSYGPQVEIAAPGVGVWSTYPPNGYRKLSGTSMAAPHVSGVAALVKRRHPAAHGDGIRVHLWRTATDLGTAGRDWLYGYGLVNAYRAVR